MANLCDELKILAIENQRMQENVIDLFSVQATANFGEVDMLGE